MPSDRNALKSGAFILLTVIAIIAIIIGIKGLRDLSEPKVLRAVSFAFTSNLSGLAVGDDVRVGGVKVGTVQSITLVGATEAELKSKEPPRIRVAYTFPSRYVLHRDAVLRVDAPLTGTPSLNFESLGSAEVLANSEELTGWPGGFQELLASAPSLQSILRNVDQKTVPMVNDTVAKFGKTAESFTGTGEHATALINDVQSKVGPAVDKYHAVADVGAQMLVKIRDLFGDTGPDFRTVVSNLATSTTTIKNKLPGIIDKVAASVASANVALEDVKAVALNAKDLSNSAKGVLVGNKGKIDNMIVSLKAASDNLKNATAEVRRSPWRLLYKPAPNEMANLNLYDAAREFAEGANELNDASLALRDALTNKEMDKESLQKLMDKVQKTFEKFATVEDKLWVKVQE